MFAYTVGCSFTDPALAEAWVGWLTGGHLAEVRAAGALDACLVKLDGPAPRYEVRYHFADRAAFEAYERDHAPRLRAAGLARFPPERGVVYVRSTGEVVASLPAERTRES